MDSHRRPPPREALSNERARELALAEVLRLEEAKKVTQSWDPPRQTTGRRAALAALAFIGAVWVWAFPPAVLSLEEAPALVGSDARVRAALQVAIGLQVDRIEEYRSETGRLPDALSEVGAVVDFDGITYTRIDARTFRVSARSGGQVATFTSSDSLAVVIRSALTTLRESNE